MMGAVVFKSAFERNSKNSAIVDWPLLFSLLFILAIGVLMVTSASIDMADKQLGKPFFYTIRQLMAIAFGLSGFMLMLKIPIRKLRSLSRALLWLVFICLILVLIPGVGKLVNGSRRWLYVGLFYFQISELVKLIVIIYLADYLANKQQRIQENFVAFIQPLLLVGLIAVLLLLQPDFGASVVIILTCLLMLFIAGAPKKQFLILLVGFIGFFISLLFAAPYRVKRFTAFLHPWENQYDSGYQLTQALIAFGRGEWFGVGLGGSVQKLFYLPESHTDFIFSVLAEELGFVGGVSIILLFFIVILRGFLNAALAKRQGDLFASFLAYGITGWLGLQAMISIGVNVGLLPTKGLTLPLMSYGGSSILIVFLALGILFRVRYEALVKSVL